jgi:hypothetical protein
MVVWKHSWLRRFLSFGSSYFCVFLESFRGICARLVPSILRRLCLVLFVGIMDRCHLCA